MENKKIKGIGASEGIAISNVFLLQKPKIEIPTDKTNNIDEELKKIRNIFEQASNEINIIKQNSEKKIGKDKAAVFDAHVQIINDPTIEEQISDEIKNNGSNIANAIDVVFKNNINIFKNMDDEYFKERAADLEDVMLRLLCISLNIEQPDLLSINKEVIIVADDLTPSQTALLEPKYVKGFLTNVGGKTSHAAIMARTMEIPAILGLSNITEIVNNGDTIAMDGSTGEIEINPESNGEWFNKLNLYNETLEKLKQFRKIKAITKDGFEIKIKANIGKPLDANNIYEYGAEGVGLYRSEFLYMDNTNWPTEDEQYEAYKYVLEKDPNKEVIVRTLDIGGDKTLSYFKFPNEMNPFLGYRAIRFCLDRKDVFEIQIRALIRASVHGKLGIMFPMIATIDEFLSAKNIVLKIMNEFKENNIPYDENIKIGMMIEIPSSAISSDQFAQYADFFSIGTNDLIQYSFAVDRMSEKIKYLYQPNNPSLLRMVWMTVWGAKKHNIPVGMCGEVASDIKSLPLLLGINGGLNSLSMSVSSIPRIKYIISQISHKDCIKLAQKAMHLNTEEEINKLVEDFYKKNNIII